MEQSIDHPRPESVARRGPAAALLALFLLAPGLVACGPRNEPHSPTPPASASAPSPGKERATRLELPPEVLAAPPGFFARSKDSDELRFTAWESEATVNQAIRSFRNKGGGVVYFAPGRYEVRHGFFIHGIDDVALVAAPGVELVFPDAGPEADIRLREPADKGQEVLHVSGSQGLTVGGRYQLFAANGRGGRLLEFVIRGIDGDQLKLTRPVHFMSHVKAIPAGSRLLEELNFVRVLSASNITVQGFVMNGRGRGPVLGHTTYSGILVENRFHAARKAGKPLFHGLQVLDNEFRGLKGRGLAIYGTAESRVEDNLFEQIRTQALEMDHYTSGRVLRNRIRDAAVAIQLDDAFDTIVAENDIEASARSIVVLGHFDDAWANTGHRILANRIVGPSSVGVELSERARGNVVADNRMSRVRHVVKGSLEQNQVSGNEASTANGRRKNGEAQR